MSSKYLCLKSLNRKSPQSWNSSIELIRCYSQYNCASIRQFWKINPFLSTPSLFGEWFRNHRKEAEAFKKLSLPVEIKLNSFLLTIVYKDIHNIRQIFAHCSPSFQTPLSVPSWNFLIMEIVHSLWLFLGSWSLKPSHFQEK